MNSLSHSQRASSIIHWNQEMQFHKSVLYNLWARTISKLQRKDGLCLQGGNGQCASWPNHIIIFWRTPTGNLQGRPLVWLQCIKVYSHNPDSLNWIRSIIKPVPLSPGEWFTRWIIHLVNDRSRLCACFAQFQSHAHYPQAHIATLCVPLSLVDITLILLTRHYEAMERRQAEIVWYKS